METHEHKGEWKNRGSASQFVPDFSRIAFLMLQVGPEAQFQMRTIMLDFNARLPLGIICTLMRAGLLGLPQWGAWDGQ